MLWRKEDLNKETEDKIYKQIFDENFDIESLFGEKILLSTIISQKNNEKMNEVMYEMFVEFFKKANQNNFNDSMTRICPLLHIQHMEILDSIIFNVEDEEIAERALKLLFSIYSEKKKQINDQTLLLLS